MLSKSLQKAQKKIFFFQNSKIWSCPALKWKIFKKRRKKKRKIFLKIILRFLDPLLPSQNLWLKHSSCVSVVPGVLAKEDQRSNSVLEKNPCENQKKTKNINNKIVFWLLLLLLYRNCCYGGWRMETQPIRQHVFIGHVRLWLDQDFSILSSVCKSEWSGASAAILADLPGLLPGVPRGSRSSWFPGWWTKGSDIRKTPPPEGETAPWSCGLR